MSIAKPGKQVSQSPTVVCAGRGTAATSSTAPHPLASASMPSVPATPAIETSFAAAGRTAPTAASMVRSSAGVRLVVESH